jgi:DNA-binding response OmpR family regulator
LSVTMNNHQRIMLVDEDRDMPPLLNTTLETEGYDTVVVTDEGTTLAMLDRMEPDLVILNSGSEGNENFQELERIRRHSDVPVIILAADYEMKALRRAFSLGADDYIRKPFPMRPFLARVRAKLRRAREYSYHSSLITT